jgi:ATP-dependent RNA helicase RhlE
MNFSDFALSSRVLKGVENADYTAPLPIQEQVIPAVLEGEDVIGCAQTGTGKTAAYLLPIIEGLVVLPNVRRFHPRALILAPTRELARQVGDHFAILAKFTKLRATVIYGGVELGNQERDLNNGVDVVIATPGRLLEHLSRGALKFRDLVFLVIDEADRLFDTGFMPDIRKIIDAVPERRQTLLFSATMSEEMEGFARAILRQPKRIQIGLVAPRENIDESYWPVPHHQKQPLLQAILKEQGTLEQVLLFVRTRERARELTPLLKELTGLEVAELHAELSQDEREETITNFRSGKVQLMVATDVASRGLDIEGISHVINYDVPNTPDDYIHRIGRTGRVDRPGVAITLVSPRELALATTIEASLRHTVPMRRILGFPYDADEDKGTQILFSKKKTSAKNFTQRELTPGKKENPFTRTGRLKNKYRTEDDVDEKKQQHNLRKAEKRLKNKKLPHQRRH